MALSTTFLDDAERELASAKADVDELTSILRRNGRLGGHATGNSASSAQTLTVATITKSTETALSRTRELVLSTLHESARTAFRPSEMRSTIESLNPNTSVTDLELLPEVMGQMLSAGELQRDLQGRYIRPAGWVSLD